MRSTCLSTAVALGMLAGLAAPAFADPVKIDFWYGNTGDIGKRVQEVCQHFNESQKDYEVVCTSQGSYDAAVQNTIAAYRASSSRPSSRSSTSAPLDLMLSDAYYPASKLMADNGYKVDWNDYFPGIARLLRDLEGRDVVLPLQLLDRRALLEQGCLRQDRQDRGARRPGKKPRDDMKALKAAGYDCPFAFDISADESWQLLEQFSAINNQPIATKTTAMAGSTPSSSSTRPRSCTT